MNNNNYQNDGDISRSFRGPEVATQPAARAAITSPAIDRRRVVFPRMLHRLLDESEANDTEHIVSWLPSGTAFKVHRREAFTNDVLPQYYRQTRYKSFVRQLNLWGFECVSNGIDKGSYTHGSLIRGEPTLCDDMHRTKIKGVLAVAASTTTRSSAEDQLSQPNAFAGDVSASSSAEDISPPSVAGEPIAVDSPPARVVITPPVPEEPVVDVSPFGNISHPPPVEDGVTPPQAGFGTRGCNALADEPSMFPIGDIDFDVPLRSSVEDFHFPLDFFDDLELFHFED